MLANPNGNFTIPEIACRCGECDEFTFSLELLDRLEEIRAWARRQHKPKAIVRVHSAYRCMAHNNRSTKEKNKHGVYGAGSNKDSKHPEGRAADFSIPGVANEAIHWYIRDTYKDEYGLGLYDWGLHLDTREIAGDWDERKESSVYAAGY